MLAMHQEPVASSRYCLWVWRQKRIFLWPWSISGPPCPAPFSSRRGLWWYFCLSSSSLSFLFVLRPGSRAPAAGAPGQGLPSRHGPHLPLRGGRPVPDGRALPQQQPAPLLHGGKCCWGAGGVGAVLAVTCLLAGRASAGFVGIWWAQSPDALAQHVHGTGQSPKRIPMHTPSLFP